MSYLVEYLLLPRLEEAEQGELAPPGFRSDSKIGGYGNPPYIARGCRAGFYTRRLGVDGLTQCHRKPPVASGGPWNRYDFPLLLEFGELTGDPQEARRAQKNGIVEK